jgi:hypothetical protein
MENKYLHKNRILLRFRSEEIYKPVTEDVWNGRDSDELCGFVKETKKVFDGTLVTVKKLIPDPVEREKKLNIIKEINALCDKNHLPKYSHHVNVSWVEEDFCQFVIEDKLDERILCENVMIHTGMRGSYPVEMYYDTHFDTYSQLWSSDELQENEYSDELKQLIVLALEEKGQRVDERYI